MKIEMRPQKTFWPHFYAYLPVFCLSTITGFCSIMHVFCSSCGFLKVIHRSQITVYNKREIRSTSYSLISFRLYVSKRGNSKSTVCGNIFREVLVQANAHKYCIRHYNWLEKWFRRAQFTCYQFMKANVS